MKVVSVALVLVLFCAGLILCEDLQVGSSLNGELAYTENVKLSAIPFKVRTKNVFYNDDTGRLIKGVWAVDLDSSKAKVRVTSGGVGSSFVNVKFKSQSGDGLNYQVQIFV